MNIKPAHADLRMPFTEFKKGVSKIMSVTKRESDAQIAAFQAENAKRKSAKKKP